MFRMHLVSWMAFAWGALLFLPIGVNYLTFLALLAALLAGGRWAERGRRIRHSPYWWPVAGFVGWTVFCLAAQPAYFAETPSNLFHGLRIALTFLVVAALDERELSSGLRGLVIGGLAGLAIAAVNGVIGLPPSDLWRSLISHHGNKSISNALIYALLAVLAVRVAFEQAPWKQSALLLIGAMACIAQIVVVLPSRTSMIAAVLAMALLAVHRWRNAWRPLVSAVAATTALAGAVLTLQPDISREFERGLNQLRAADSERVEMTNSWGVRYHLYDKTAAMVADRPVLGWGIGSWNGQWRARADAAIGDINMPHNDYLWMGAQAGIPGLIAMLALVLAGAGRCWSRRDAIGAMGLAAIVILALGASFNSALRDAAIGLSLPFVTALLVSRAVLAPSSDPPSGPDGRKPSIA